MLAMHVPGPKVPIKPLWARFLAFHTDLRIYGFTPLPPPPLGRPVHADPGIKSPPGGEDVVIRPGLGGELSGHVGRARRGSGECNLALCYTLSHLYNPLGVLYNSLYNPK